ncbi:hypothetical protein BDV96DRAFT_639874 [Lophiotrema nucula]|uniref:Uncharacterized protein n=1 Tax=Lophiotrema nucula TaxID=690887 RepID=A0A6A5ZTY2_9PLEO|nr:hypothetical protein BDV96DRAFT_639874 [Lophiotrema nucula]
MTRVTGLSARSENILNEELKELARAFLLSEKIQDKLFKNAVLSAIVECLIPRGRVVYLPNGNVIRIIYNGTPKSSKARALLVDMWAYQATDEFVRGYIDKLPAEFLSDLRKAIPQSRPKLTVGRLPLPWKESMERYHEK